MAKPRTKTRGANIPVPQSREEAARAVREIGDAGRELARLETAMNDEIAAVKERFENQATPFRDFVAGRTEGLKMWAEANRTALTGGDKTKTVDLGTGELKWRQTPPKVSIRGKVEDCIAALKRLGLKRFIRIKEEVDREAMLKDKAAARTVPGVSIGSEGEDFYVEPFEAELARAEG